MNVDIDYYQKILSLIVEKHEDAVSTLRELSKIKNGSIDTYDFYLKEADNYRQLKEKTENIIKDLNKWEY